MRAAKLVAPNQILMEETEKPAVSKPDEVLVQVRAVGICGTDLHVFQGERADVALPRVMGHELSGVVEAVGSAVTSFKPGDRVVLDPVMACGVCPVCKKDHRNVCADVKCFGVQSEGGFQDYIVATEQSLYLVPENLSFAQAALAEPFTIAANILARTAATPGEKMLVIGSGTIGLVVLQAAKLAGLTVLVCDIEDEKLAAARDCGADFTVNTSREAMQAAVMAHFPEGADIIVDAVGTPALLEQTVAMAAPTARVAVIGFSTEPAQIPPASITKKELTIVGSRMNQGRFPQVMEWFGTGSLQLDRLISKRYPLEDIQQAFEETLANGRSIVKTIIEL